MGRRGEFRKGSDEETRLNGNGVTLTQGGSVHASAGTTGAARYQYLESVREWHSKLSSGYFSGFCLFLSFSVIYGPLGMNTHPMR